MAETTGIGWCDATFNPWVGCEKVSPGCAHCYAEELVTVRMGRAGTWGAGGVRERTSEANWRKPLRWQKLAERGLLPDGKGIFNPDQRRPRVFCASLADVFEPRPELEPWRHDLFRLIEETPSLDWLLLTKRPEGARDWLRAWYGEPIEDPGPYLLFRQEMREWTSRDELGWGCLPNVWIGTSIENSRFTWRADVLREIPAAVRFISAEPLIGSLLPAGGAEPEVVHDQGREADACVGSTLAAGRSSGASRVPLDLTGIDWLIVGGESGGRDARPMHPDWARELRDAALVAGNDPALDQAFALGAPDDVIDEGIAYERAQPRPAFFFKQHGSWVFDEVNTRGHVFARYEGGVSDVPEPGAERMRYVGPSPKAGGKLLDGREWCEFPTTLQLAPA